MKKLFLLFILMSSSAGFSQEDAWVYLTDKENVSQALANPITILTQQAIDRKNAHGVLIDVRDVPVNESYISQLKAQTGILVMAKSKWFNAVHVRGNQADILALESLVFVDSIVYANHSLNTTSRTEQIQNKWDLENTLTDFNYGNALNQIQMFNGDQLHLLDYTGAGITVAVMDAGFPNVDTMDGFERLRNDGNLMGGYDFVDATSNIYANTTSNHGTWVLSTMSGYVENQYVGTAPDATYYLFRTEDATSENPVEESYWVEAAERADSLGVDVINTSLGYTVYDNSDYSYTPADMNGNTAFITKGANIAFEKGMLLVNSAGNSGNNTWSIVGAPADAEGVLSVGAVDASGNYASFSSLGSSDQPTQKPDVVAQGQSSYVIGPDDNITTLNGTSFSSPILAGGVVCLWQALPNLDNVEIMQLVRESATQYSMPDNMLGYGIPNLQIALNSALGVDNFNQQGNIKLYPNPLKNIVHIQFPKSEEEYSLEVFDVMGKRVHKTIQNGQYSQVDVSFLTKGLYLAKIKTANQSQTFKLIKE